MKYCTNCRKIVGFFPTESVKTGKFSGLRKQKDLTLFQMMYCIIQTIYSQ